MQFGSAKMSKGLKMLIMIIMMMMMMKIKIIFLWYNITTMWPETSLTSENYPHSEIPKDNNYKGNLLLSLLLSLLSLLLMLLLLLLL